MPKAPLNPDWITDEGDPDALLAKVLTYFRSCYASTEKAQRYMAQRGLGDPKLIDRFGIGYADRYLTTQLPPSTWVAGQQVRERLVELGIIRRSGHGHFNGSVVVPITDRDGCVIDIYGRKIGRKLRAGTPLHTHQHDPPQGVFNLPALDQAEDAILSRSVINALSFVAAGIDHAVALFDLTEERLQALQHTAIQRAFIALPRTDDGACDADRVAHLLTEAGIDAYRIDFPRGMDANDFLVSQPEPQAAFRQLVHAAQWMGNGIRPGTTPPPPPKAEEEPAADDHKDEEVVHLDGRRYRVRGLANNLTYNALRVNLMVSNGSDGFHVDVLDLYVAKQRSAYIKQTAGELHVAQDDIKHDLGKLILRLEQIQDARIQATLDATKVEPLVLTEQERQDAVDLLTAPDLIHRLQADFDACGVIGERSNRLVAYLAATSRKLDRPLAVVIQSSSSSGKSALMNSVIDFMPPEELIRFSSMTAQSLYYMGEHDLKHRILAIAEEEGAERASYPLKLLQSEGHLSIASTGKDPVSGQIRTQEYRVEGPTMLMMTTTALQVDEELLNRCIVLAVDESRQQTRAVHQHQRHAQTLDGLLQQRDRDRIRQVQRNAQRLLRPLLVVNPFADRLTFLDDRTRTRRDHLKYLTLIRAIALLHQYQRTTQTVAHDGARIEYIEATPDDIRLANRLISQVLSRSLDDLAPQTRRLLHLLTEMVSAQEEPSDFTRRDVMQFTGWTYKQVRIHLQRLRDLEYLTARRTPTGIGYQLVVTDTGQSLPTIDLMDAEALTGQVEDA